MKHLYQLLQPVQHAERVNKAGPQSGASLNTWLVLVLAIFGRIWIGTSDRVFAPNLAVDTVGGELPAPLILERFPCSALSILLSFVEAGCPVRVIFFIGP